MTPLAEFIGESPGIAAIRQQIARLLERQPTTGRLPPLLLLGETGTGKGLLARAIHRAGPRSSGRFVAINCAAIPETLLEAELFGFEKGAFTDARQAKAGLFQAAHRGTLFLDEIALLPEGLQAKLLTALEDRMVRRLGSTRDEAVDVWLMAAASMQLEEAVRAGRFRAELYHRLAVLTLRLPPLRERPQDIPLLAAHFLARACADYGLDLKTLSEDAETALLAYRWPGNIRELQNVIERAVLLAEAPVITATVLALGAAQQAPGSGDRDERTMGAAAPDPTRLLEALHETGWNVSRAALQLGVTRDTVRYRIRKYRLRPEQNAPPIAPPQLASGALPAGRGYDPIAADEAHAAPHAGTGGDIQRRLTPFVGRALELGMLLDRFTEVKCGRGQVVFIAGEPGIGKSRLVLEFRRALAAAGEALTWIDGHCLSTGQSIPFLPLVDQLKQIFRIEEFDSSADIIAKIEAGAASTGGLERHIPYLRYLLAVDPGDSTIATMDATVRRERLFAALRALTAHRASIQPLVLVMEDLHWIDASTEQYLACVMDALAAIPVMLLLTYRLEYSPPFGTRSFHTTLALHSLTEGDALALAGNVLRGQALGDDLKAELLARAEGVPLFIEEMTRALLDLGVLRLESGTFRLLRPVWEVGLPQTIQGAIMARLNRLGEEGKRIVQAASVIGRQFSYPLLARVINGVGQLGEIIEQLKKLEIVYERPGLQEPVYLFKHALIQDVACGSLTRERHKELHRVVAHAIEDLFADRLADRYEELAHHFAAGEEWRKAFEYAVQAGDRAKDAYANQAALDWYAKALEVAEHIRPPVAARKLAETYQRRSQVWMLLSRHSEALADSERMLEMARAAGDRQAEGEALADMAAIHWGFFSQDHVPPLQRSAEEALRIAQEIGDRRILARSLTGLALIDHVEGRLLEADRKHEESIRISEAGGFKSITMQNRMWLGNHSYWRGEFRGAVPVLIKAEHEAANLRDGWFELMAIAFRCLALVALGEYMPALAVIDDGLKKARERGNLFLIGRLTNSLGWLYQEVGDFERALDRDREAAEVARSAKTAEVEISSLINIASDYIHLGESSQALSLLEELIVRVEKQAFGLHRWRWSLRLSATVAEALVATGDEGRALAFAEKGLAQARATGSMKYVAKSLALRGELALRARAPGRAQADLREALRIAHESEYPALIWQVAHVLSQAHAGRNEMQAACAAAQLATQTIDTVAARIPDATLQRTFLSWPRVQAVRDGYERLRKS